MGKDQTANIEEEQKEVEQTEDSTETDLPEDEVNESTTDENLSEAETDQVVEDATEVKEDTVTKLEEKINELTKEKDEIYDRLLRTQAEYENFKRRSQQEKIQERKYKSQDLANELLPVLDNFERALEVEKTAENEHLFDGILMVYNQLQDALESESIVKIKAEGESFDPNLHHAVMQVEDDTVESNIVVEELQTGYKLHDRVIRPAMVKVNK